MSLNVAREMEDRASPLLEAGLLEASEHDLVVQAKAGSAGAFNTLVERYERRIFRLAQNIARNRQDAEDAMQNALVKAYLNLPGFREDSRFYTWLVSITVNEALMGIRRRRVNEVSMDDSNAPDGVLLRDEIEDCGPSPEQHYSRRQMQAILATTIHKLSPRDRMIFQLREVEGLSTQETAQALALSVSAVKSRLQRARLRLRKFLNSYFGPRVRRNRASLLIFESSKTLS